MIALTENQLESIENELKKNITEIDSQICEAESAMKKTIADLAETHEGLATCPEYQQLQSQLSHYGKGVRALRASLASLEKETHELVSPQDLQKNISQRRDEIADQIQKETHDAPATFSDFVKSMMMWRDNPEDRLKS